MGLLGVSLGDPVSLARLGLILRTRLAGGGFRAVCFDALPDGLAGIVFPLLWRWLEKGETVLFLLFMGEVEDELEMFLGERLCWGGVLLGMVEKCTSWDQGCQTSSSHRPLKEKKSKSTGSGEWKWYGLRLYNLNWEKFLVLMQKVLRHHIKV